MKYNFLKNETFGVREQVTFIGNELKIYIPRKWFDSSLGFAVMMGDKVQTHGFFWFETEKKWYRVQVGVPIMFQFRDETKVTKSLRPGQPSIEYNVFILNRGDAFLWDVMNKKDVDQVKVFFNSHIEGAKLPENIPYSQVYQAFLSMMRITDAGSLGVSGSSFEFLLSQLYRNKNNQAEPMRLAYNGKKDEYGYKMNRITALTRSASQFTSLIGEDIQTSLASAILRTRQKKQDQHSPIEKILKY